VAGELVELMMWPTLESHGVVSSQDPVHLIGIHERARAQRSCACPPGPAADSLGQVDEPTLAANLRSSSPGLAQACGPRTVQQVQEPRVSWNTQTVHARSAACPRPTVVVGRDRQCRSNRDAVGLPLRILLSGGGFLDLLDMRVTTKFLKGYTYQHNPWGSPTGQLKHPPGLRGSPPGPPKCPPRQFNSSSLLAPLQTPLIGPPYSLPCRPPVGSPL
jgi:hypothetical protein